MNCFDYYHFGSVSVEASAISAPVPGQPLVFQGTVTNTNAYPVVDGQVYAKVFRKDSRSDDLVRLNGYPIVDFFLVSDNVSLPAKGSKEVSFGWTVPQNAGGDYLVAFYFTAAHRFNLLGLSFTDDVIGGQADFHVDPDSGAVPPVRFDKDTLLLNGNAVHPTTLLSHIAKEDTATFTTDVTNPSDVEKTVSIAWVTSEWDGILSSHEAKTDTTTVTLSPKERKRVTYVIPTLPTSVSYLAATLTDGDAKSLVFARFVRDGYEDVRLNFPAVTTYPLTQGQSVDLFSCVHAVNQFMVDGNTLVLTLKDDTGKTLHSYTYSGSITGSMMGLKDAYTPESTLANFSLTATLSHQGKTVDEVTLQYHCNDIDPSVCSTTEGASVSHSGSSVFTKSLMSMVFVIVAIGALFVAGFVFVRSRQKPGNTMINK